MIKPDEALRLVLEAARRNPSLSVPLVDACGLELADPIRADRDNPPFRRAMMDGYAVRTEDAAKTIRVAGEVAAGQSVKTPVRSGACLEIMTGAACPPDTEAVVPKEQVRRSGNEVVLPRHIAPGQHIAPQGSECREGQSVLEAGEAITPMAIAVMASFGLKSAPVIPRPTMAIITTGAELISLDETPDPAKIRDSNGPMLVAMACDMGLRPPRHLHASDRLEEIVKSLNAAADAQIVLLTGGVSVGTYDLVPQALDRYGAEPVFHKVSQKPGKPLLVACKGSQLVFGLPGNPLACHMCFHRYVAAAVRKMEGKQPVTEPLVGRLTEPVEPKGGRTFFVAARAEPDPDGQRNWQVRPLPGTSSADVFASASANCYAEVPPGTSEIPAGERIRFTWIGNAPWPN